MADNSRVSRSRKEKNPFTQVDNAVISRGDMSLAALGLYTYLRKLPIDWVIYKKEIMGHFTNGRHAFETAWDELEKIGYLSGADLIRSNGKFKGRDYVFTPLLPTDEKKIADYYTDAGNQHRLDDSPMREINITDAGNQHSTDAGNQQLQITEIQQRLNIQRLNSKAYALCVDFWLKEFHPDWDFKAVQGTHLKQIIQKIKKLLAANNRKTDDEEIVAFFKAMCLGLPEWFKTKDIQMLNGKFNEVIEQIKQSKNGNATTNNRHESQFRN